MDQTNDGMAAVGTRRDRNRVRPIVKNLCLAFTQTDKFDVSKAIPERMRLGFEHPTQLKL